VVSNEKGKARFIVVKESWVGVGGMGCQDTHGAEVRRHGHEISAGRRCVKTKKCRKISDCFGKWDGVCGGSDLGRSETSGGQDRGGPEKRSEGG
jgi:hypothetical protein